jgi:hypothetical protein
MSDERMNEFETSLLQAAPESVLTGIPQPLRDIPQRITDATGIVVQVRPMSKGVFTHAPGMEKSPLVLDIDADKQAITIWYGEGQLSSAMVSHELIHLRRDVIESIPKLAPGAFASPSITGEVYFLENDLEHLLVIPEEIRIFPESEQHWADHYKSTIQSASERGDQFALALHWAQIRNSLPKQIELAKTLAVHIRSYGDGFVKYSDYLREDFKTALHSKSALHKVISLLRPELVPVMGTARFTIENGALERQPLTYAGKVLFEEEETRH